MSQTLRNEGIRNVAVIAHVDHGKTTLVDAFLRETGVLRENRSLSERVMDSNDLERERGITILAKNTSVSYKGIKINIVDTPGHADFGGEVERTLSMVDGALLLVDALDGPMPQTRFVVQKALEHRLKLVLVINKIDRPDARVQEVLNDVFDLLVNLGAGDDDVDFPVVYTDARAGFATADPEIANSYTRARDRSGFHPTILPVLDAIIDRVPAPLGNVHAPLRMMVSTLSHDDYVGRIAIGRVESGIIRKGQEVSLCRLDGSVLHCQVSRLWLFHGLKKIDVTEAAAGDIAAISGIEDVSIGETVADPTDPEPLPPIRVDEPTMMVTFRVNDSPFSGRSGDYLTSRHLRDRLYREARKDPSLRVEDTKNPDAFRVSGRGELHLGILIENMRREGYEMAISKPEVILKGGGSGKMEPYEVLSLDIPEEYMGRVMEELGPRKAELMEMHHDASGRIRMVFTVPTRGLMGFRPVFLTITKGTGIMHHVFDHYGDFSGDITTRREGAMISWEAGVTTTYALHNAQERGILFVGPGEEVYGGQVVGQNSRSQDLDINVCKKKHLTNMRASTSDETLRLTPPRSMSLEDSLQWIREDELVEVTPKAIRLRKMVLDRNDRYRLKKDRGEELDEEK
ncbi:MAG: translational GTPase TypA [Bacillota bacterium]|jgi:GTP-binding protein|nr:translational GTPase TypA [Candidatus Fermentithermobacillaceae bacterium]